MVIFYYSDIHILQKKMKKINVGIIGRNFGYKVIFKALKNISAFNVIGFSFKKKKLMSFPEDIKIYKNWKSLISDKKINAVFISSPPKTHKEIIKYSIKKKKHIFCDKPVTTSFKDISEICKDLEGKNITNFVNYEFNNIEAFKIFKKKYFHKLKISKVNVKWLIKIPSKNRSSWKNSHQMGGGNFFNYICHILFYLENFFGILEIYDSKLKNSKNKFELNTKLLTKDKKIKVNLDFKTISQSNKLKSFHKVVFFSNKGNYILYTKMNNLFDQFLLLNNKKIIFKPKEINYDFRLKPTQSNIISFKNSIIKKRNISPNFQNAKRIHYLIKQLINFRKLK